MEIDPHAQLVETPSEKKGEPYRLYKIGHSNTHTVSLRCPICRHEGSFEGLPDVADVTFSSAGAGHRAGMRKCPNAACRAGVHLRKAFDTRTAGR
jgi:hypothetical protein